MIYECPKCGKSKSNEIMGSVLPQCICDWQTPVTTQTWQGYDPTPKQERAIREYLHESIVPLIEQVLVKKLGQAMSYAAQELVNPKREWVGLTDEEVERLKLDGRDLEFVSMTALRRFACDIELKLKDKNHG